VTLRTFVRVTPGWYESDSKLRDLGYEPANEKDAGDEGDEREKSPR
jgi:hypothetical protein